MKMSQCPAAVRCLGLQEVTQHGAGRRQGRVLVFDAKAGERRDLEMATQALRSLSMSERPRRPRRERTAGHRSNGFDDRRRCALWCFGVEQLRRIYSSHLVDDLSGGQVKQRESAG